MKRTYWMVLLYSLVLSLMVSCEKKAPESRKPPPIPGCIIFLDTSVSMRGFFRAAPSAQTTIQRFMCGHLLGILSENGIEPACLSVFGSQIGPPQRITSLRRSTFFTARQEIEDTYRETETNLIGVFNNSAFGQRAFSIIVTDGLQSRAEGAHNIAGFDPRLFTVIRDKNNSGVNIWLIGVKSEFAGTVYPESLGRDGRRTPFPHSGLRPVYIWIVSHDFAKGYTLTQEVLADLRSICSPDDVKVAQLTRLQLPHPGIHLDTSVISTPKWHIKSKQVGTDSFEWLVPRTTESETINIPISLDEREQSHLDVNWNINLELEPLGIRWARLLKENERWILSLTHDSIPGAPFIPGCTIGKGNLKVVATATPQRDPDPWWRSWSTPDDSRPADGDKTLYLEKLSPIIEAPLRQIYTVGQVVLDVRTP